MYLTVSACLSVCACMCPSAYLCLLVCLCAFTGRSQTRKHKPSACADIPSGFRLLFFLPLSTLSFPCLFPPQSPREKAGDTVPPPQPRRPVMVPSSPCTRVLSQCEPPALQDPWFGDTGPLHTSLSKHLLPPVSRRKSPDLKPTSSALVIFRPFLASLLHHYFLVGRQFLRRLPRVLSTQSCQVLESLTLSLSLMNHLPTRPGILT